jgi:hypothetical protein
MTGQRERDGERERQGEREKGRGRKRESEKERERERERERQTEREREREREGKREMWLLYFCNGMMGPLANFSYLVMIYSFENSTTCGLYYKTITIVIMTIVSDATVWSITYDRN